MRVGDNIREIREFEKNFKRSYVAQKLNISTRAYANIENNVTDITLNRLEEIANIFECTISYILNHKQSKREFYNHFHNYKGNNGVNIMNQRINNKNNGENSELIFKLQEELLVSERSRIALLETLLKLNNIEIK